MPTASKIIAQTDTQTDTETDTETDTHRHTRTDMTKTLPLPHTRVVKTCESTFTAHSMMSNVYVQ